MKTLQQFAASFCLLGLLTTAVPALGNNNEKESSVRTGWVPSASNSFTVRTMYSQKDNLTVWVTNAKPQQIVIRILDKDGSEVAFYPLHKKPQSHAVRFDLHEIPNGDYRVEVMSSQEKITKLVSLATPESPTRRATLAVVD